MPIKVVEIHHHAVRIKGDENDLKANLDFYHGLLGLNADAGRPNIPGVPGFWINVGEAAGSDGRHDAIYDVLYISARGAFARKARPRSNLAMRAVVR